MTLAFGCLEEGCENVAYFRCHEPQTKEEIEDAWEQNITGYCKEHRQSQ